MFERRHISILPIRDHYLYFNFEFILKIGVKVGLRHVRVTLKLFHEGTPWQHCKSPAPRYFYFDFKFTNQMSKLEDAFDSTRFAFICSKGELEKSAVSSEMIVFERLSWEGSFYVSPEERCRGRHGNCAKQRNWKKREIKKSIRRLGSIRGTTRDWHGDESVRSVLIIALPRARSTREEADGLDRKRRNEK